jgi:hypothetical protein
MDQVDVLEGGSPKGCEEQRVFVSSYRQYRSDFFIGFDSCENDELR